MKTNFIDLTGVEKAAIFLLMMGEEYTTKVLKKVSKEEVSNILSAMSDFEMVMPELYLAVAKEFVEKFKAKDQTIVAGDDFIHKIIEKSFDKAKAAHFRQEFEEGRR
jgi:flagellar motor switch protein FliG